MLTRPPHILVTTPEPLFILLTAEKSRDAAAETRIGTRRDYEAVPEAVEGTGYRMPGYKLHGGPMLYFAGFKEHDSLFAASVTFFPALEDELSLTKSVPVKLIARIAKLRAAGIAATSKKPALGREKEWRK